MDAQLEIKLIECLDALAQGESLERILARYPQESDQLRPLLESAASLSALRREPSEAAKMRSRQNFMAQADLLRRTAPRKTMGFLPRFAIGFLAAMLVAIVLGTSAVASAGSALPGDPLYGLKRTVENVQLDTASSPTQRQELQQEFDRRRRDETNELLDAGREGEVEFVGTIESLQPESWIVSGLVVQIDADTQIEGTPQINRMAEVHGVTGPNGLRARAISIESSDEQELIPTPEATETPSATETPEPTRTVAPPTTATRQPTTILQPTATPRPTATPQPTPTPQPVEVEFTGRVNAMNAGTWDIDGTTIIVNASTEIRDSIAPGQRVKVKALRQGDGRLIATRIELSEDGGGGDDSNSNGNQNSNEDQNSNNDNSNDDGGNSNSNGNGNDDRGNDSNDSGGGNSNDNHNENENDNSNGNGN